MEILDISSITDPEDYFPCCPLCDNEILEWEETAIVVQHGSKALSHLSCVENEDMRP